MASPPSPHKEERAILEAIRQGKAPTIVKRQASRGTLPVDAEEMVEILVFPTHAPAPTCSGTARQTLGGWPPEKIAAALAQPEASAEALAYFAAQKDLPESLLTVIAGHANAGDEALAPLARGAARAPGSPARREGRGRRRAGRRPGARGRRGSQGRAGKETRAHQPDGQSGADVGVGARPARPQGHQGRADAPRPRPEQGRLPRRAAIAQAE